MTEQPNREVAVLNAALELRPAERAAYLNQACAGDAALRKQVEGLLQAHDQAERFLDVPPAGLDFQRTVKVNIPLTEKPGDMIGRYKLLQQIGEGGCGVVYMAEQEEPVRRRVALKVIKLGMDTKQVIARFEAERQALALMDHPNIAKIHDAGITDAPLPASGHPLPVGRGEGQGEGSPPATRHSPPVTSPGRPYFVMELVRGTKITDFCDENKLSTEDRLKLFIQVCQAIQHAHQKGVIHRDIKPSNILVTINDGLPVPKVIDFGIAKATAGRLTDQTLFTAFEQFIGTPAYMSPEQAVMTSLDIDTRSDIYSLGVLLYELLTGGPPFDQKELLAAGLDEMRRTIRETEPPKPSTRLGTMAADALTTTAKQHHTDAPKLIHLLRGDLDWIAMKCLEKDRMRRYETASGLASDIRRHLSNEPVVARPPSRIYRFQKSVHRNKLAYAAAAAIATVLLFGSVISTWQAIRATHAEREQKRLRAAAETAEHETEQQLYTALLEQGRANVHSGELGQRTKALDAVRIAAGISNSAALRGVALAAHALPDLRFERELPYGNEFTMRNVDPAFERIALCRGRGPVEIRSTTNLSLLATLAPSTNLPAYAADWSPDGRYLAIKRDYPPSGASSDKEVWDMKTGKLLVVLHDAPFSSISFHPRFPRVLVGRSNGAAVWDLEQRSEVHRIALDRTPLFLRFSPEGERFAAAYAADGAWIVSVHQVASGELLSSNVFDAFVANFNWHPSGSWLAVPDYGSSVYRFDAETGEKRLLGRHKAQATRTAFSPDGDYLMSGGWDRELLCWDARTLQRPLSIWLNGYVGWFRADGQAFALQTETAVQFHSFERSSGHREFAEDLGPLLRYAAFSADGRCLAAAGTERVGVWDLQHPGPGALATNSWDTRLAFAANGDLFADHLGGGFRWQVSPATNSLAPPGLLPLALVLPEGFASLGIISNGVALTGSRGSAVVKAEDVGSASRDWQPTEWGYNGVSQDGRWFAVFRPYTSYLFVHRLPGLQRVAILTNMSIIRSFQFSPANDEVAVSCRRGVEFWNVATWQRTRAVTNLNNQLYSADGRTMWLTREFRAGGLHDARTLELLMPLPIGTYPLAVSPDGRRLAVSVDLRRLQVWDLEEVRGQLRELGLDWAERKELTANPR